MNDNQQLYEEWLSQIEKGELRPSVRAGTRFISHRLCRGAKQETLTPLGMSMLLNQWFIQAVKDEVLLINPDYINGRAKYLVRSQVRPEKTTITA